MRLGIVAKGVVAVALGFAAVLMVGAETPKEKGRTTADGLDGTWKLMSGEFEGQPLPEAELHSGKLVINGANYTVVMNSLGTLKGTQKLDETKTPHTIDIVDASGPNQGKTSFGIYEHQGDKFRVVLTAQGQPRPTTFSTAPKSGQWMHVWQRVPTDAKADGTH